MYLNELNITDTRSHTTVFRLRVQIRVGLQAYTM